MVISISEEQDPICDVMCFVIDDYKYSVHLSVDPRPLGPTRNRWAACL